jgi:hypothetical protein
LWSQQKQPFVQPPCKYATIPEPSLSNEWRNF